MIEGLLVTLIGVTPCRANDLEDAARENRLRAGYVFNFAKFVEWPAFNPTDDLTVCFVGATGVRDAFAAAAAGKQIGTHRVAARSLEARDPTKGCQIVYIELLAPGSKSSLGAADAGVLTVGDQRDFIHQGGIVGLFTENNRLRFNINLEIARRAGLKISSSLLQLASHVEETAP